MKFSTHMSYIPYLPAKVAQTHDDGNIGSLRSVFGYEKTSTYTARDRVSQERANIRILHASCRTLTCKDGLYRAVICSAASLVKNALELCRPVLAVT